MERQFLPPDDLSHSATITPQQFFPSKNSAPRPAWQVPHSALMKPIASPHAEEFATLIKESRQAAKAAGLTETDLQDTVAEVRRAHRR